MSVVVVVGILGEGKQFVFIRVFILILLPPDHDNSVCECLFTEKIPRNRALYQSVCVHVVIPFIVDVTPHISV